MNRATASMITMLAATLLAVPVLALGADKNNPDADFFKHAGVTVKSK